MNLYDRVKDLCNERGISIRQLEIRLGIGNGIIARWKTSIPNSERLDKVAEFFGVSTDYLLGKKPKEEFITFYDKDIARMAQEIKDRPELSLRVRGTKSKNAKRDIPIPINLSRLIQNSLKSSNKAPEGYLCKLSSPALRDRWLKLKATMNAQDDLVPYCLRHTYCTDLQRKGVDLRIAQKLMGHSTVDLTSTIYSHLDEDLFTITAKVLL